MTNESLSPNQRWRNGCVYCGAVYDLERDHVIPTSYMRTKRTFGGDWLVSACNSCNGLLGSELIFNVPDRAAFVRTAILRKYRRKLHAVRWDDEDMEDLGENMRSMIRLANYERFELERRLGHLELVMQQPVNYLAGTRPYIDPENDEVLEHVDPELYSKFRREEAIRLAKRRHKKGRYSA